jgi:hypothetical protein
LPISMGFGRWGGPLRERRLLRLRLDHGTLACVQADTNATKPALAATLALNVMTFPRPECRLHQRWQLAQKDGFAHRRQFARLDDFIKERPSFLASEVSVGIGHEVFLDEAPDRAVLWNVRGNGHLRPIDERIECRDDPANNLNLV